jgi:hypothetical protein
MPQTLRKPLMSSGNGTPERAERAYTRYFPVPE